MPSANKKSLILISFVLIAYLVTGCDYKNSDLLTIPNDKKLGKGLYQAINRGYNKYISQSRLFLTKVKPEEIEMMCPILEADIHYSKLYDEGIRQIDIIEAYKRGIIYARENSSLLIYDKIYHSCLSLKEDINAMPGPIFIEINKDNIVSMLAIVHYKKSQEQTDKNNNGLPINYNYAIPPLMKSNPIVWKDAIGYSKAYILTGSKLQEKSSCLNIHPLSMLRYIYAQATKIGINRLVYRMETLSFYNDDKMFYNFDISSIEDLVLKELISKLEKSEHNNLDYSSSIAIFSGGKGEALEYIGLITDTIAFASRTKGYDDDYIHYELDTKNNIASFTNKDGKGKTYKYKMSASSMQNLKEDIIKYEKNSTEINFHFLDIRRIEKAFREKKFNLILID